jgi:hypothetical protein
MHGPVAVTVAIARNSRQSDWVRRATRQQDHPYEVNNE